MFVLKLDAMLPPRSNKFRTPRSNPKRLIELQMHNRRRSRPRETTEPFHPWIEPVAVVIRSVIRAICPLRFSFHWATIQAFKKHFSARGALPVPPASFHRSYDTVRFGWFSSARLHMGRSGSRSFR